MASERTAADLSASLKYGGDTANRQVIVNVAKEAIEALAAREAEVALLRERLKTVYLTY